MFRTQKLRRKADRGIVTRPVRQYRTVCHTDRNIFLDEDRALIIELKTKEVKDEPTSK